MNKLHLVTLSAFLLWTPGFIKGKDVTQTDTLWKHESEDATMQCNHTKGDLYYQMYWYRQLPGETMELIVFTSTTTSEHDFGEFDKDKFAATKTKADTGTFTVKRLEPKDEALYFCAVREGSYNEAYFGAGTKLTVLENEHNITPPKVTVLRPSAKECRDPKDNQRKKTLVCVATGFYPDHVTVSWKINDENVTSGVATDAAALPDGKFYKTTSRLRVSAEDWFKPDNKFTCIVKFFNGTQYQDYKNSVNGVEAEDGKVMTREKYLRIAQNAKLSYGVFIVKSCIYGAFVAFLVWKLQSSAGK